jgi:hypothetical protein
MTFKARPSRFELGVAPTSRARCRGCKRAVEKGETRLVTHAFVRPGRGTCFVRHVGCVTATLLREVLAVHGSVERVPVGAGMDAARVDEAREALSVSRGV